MVLRLLKPGDRLLGSAAVNCPECERGRTYIVYIVWGEGGWFSEVKDETSGRILIPKNFLKETREAYFTNIEAEVPEAARMPIQER